MVKLYETGAYLVNGTRLIPGNDAGQVKALTGKEAVKEEAQKGTIAYSIRGCKKFCVFGSPCFPG
ncbi:MAG: hypothetical protein HFG62_17800 [Lachnospiraceae bacterium]|jgi:aconitate hydratase|nr:hypothetical protein [Lachnospiraceae bacterium]